MIYSLSYLSDLQRSYLIKSSVFIVSNEDNSRRLSTESEDLQYLPPVFINNVQQINSRFNLPVCYELAILRFASLWISSNSFVKVEIPFLPNSDNFNLFFEQSKQNRLINLITYQGERIQAYHLRSLK